MLTKQKRKFLFWLTIIVFFILSVGVLFYSLGYSFGPQWQIQKTGGIFIQSNQSGATITIDNKIEKNTSLISHNALINDLRPGVHEVKVEKEGFRSWYKVLDVAPEIVSARDALLIPSAPVVTSVATTTPELMPSYSLIKHTIYNNEKPKPKTVFVGVERFWQLSKEGSLLIFGEDKNFYLNNKKIGQSTSSPDTFLDLENTIVSTLLSLLKTKHNLIFDDGENRVVYWDEHTIGSYWIGKLDKMPQWQKTRSTLILTIPAEIRNIMIFPDHADYLLIEMGNSIWALEMDSLQGQNLIPVYQGENPQLLGKNSNTVFITDKNQYLGIELP